MKILDHSLSAELTTFEIFAAGFRGGVRLRFSPAFFACVFRLPFSPAFFRLSFRFSFRLVLVKLLSLLLHVAHEHSH